MFVIAGPHLETVSLVILFWPPASDLATCGSQRAAVRPGLALRRSRFMANFLFADDSEALLMIRLLASCHRQ